jgi:hypothetical protein
MIQPSSKVMISVQVSLTSLARVVNLNVLVLSYRSYGFVFSGVNVVAPVP